MQGSVIKRGGTWSVVVDLGRDSITGKRIRRWHSGFKTKREAERARVEILGRIAQGTYVKPDRLPLRRFLKDEWLPAIKANVRAGTFSEYTRCVERYVQTNAIAAVQLQQLTPAAINAFYADLLTSGRRQRNGGLSPKTVRNVHGVLHKGLDDAVRWGRITRNVADLVDPPRWARPEMSVWTAEELRRFLAHVADDRLFAAWLLVATTGMRRGELLGLRWRDLDLDGAVAKIVHTLAVVDYEVRASEPKTDKGRRAVALDTATVGALRTHRVRQAEERLAVGAAWHDNGLVFALPDGRPIHPQRFSQWFDQRRRAAGLPRIRLHDVRHTYASLALAAGENPKVVSERIGHAAVSITLDVYQHVNATMQRDTAERVASLILGDS